MTDSARAGLTAPDYAVLAAGSPWSVEQWSQAWVITVDGWENPDDVPKVWQAVLNMSFAMSLSFSPVTIARSFAEVKVLYDRERAATTCLAEMSTTEHSPSVLHGPVSDVGVPRDRKAEESPDRAAEESGSTMLHTPQKGDG